MKCKCNVHVAKMYFDGEIFKCNKCMPYEVRHEKCKSVEQILNLFRRARTRQDKIRAIYSYLVFKKAARSVIIYGKRNRSVSP